MRILIAYASKNGAAKRCAQMLSESLPSFAKTDVIDITVSLPRLEDYDVAVVGSSVRCGKINKKAKRFIKDNKKALSEMPSAVYLCCCFADRFEEYAEMELPKELEASLGIHYFGGEFKPDALKGVDKIVAIIVREMIKSKELGSAETQNLSLPELLPENISLLAHKIKDLNR